MSDVVIRNEELENVPQELSRKERKGNKIVSNVNVKQCFFAILFCVVMFALTAIPFTFGSLGFHFTFEYFPFIGNGQIIEPPTEVIEGLGSILPLNQSFLDILGLGLQYFIIAFFGILAVDIFMALLLMIFRANFLRIVFKFFSVIFAFAMLAIALLGILYLVGTVVGGLINSELIRNGNGITELLSNVFKYFEGTGILFVLVLTIISFFMIIKQLRWFSKLW